MDMFTKSDLLIALQCPLYLWKKHHAFHELAPASVSQRSRMEMGTAVGACARQLYANGIMLDRFIQDVEDMRSVLDKRVPLFEIGIMFKDMSARVDILLPSGSDSWDIVEVKATTGIKDQHYDDVAFQKYVLEGAGIRVAHSYVLHLDSSYVRHGQLELNRLFTKEDITEVVSIRQQKLADTLTKAREILSERTPPTVPIGEHCTTPHHCPLMARCFAHIPENSVLDLYTIKKYQAFALINTGIVTYDQLPKGFSPNERQRIQIQATLSGTVHVEPAHIQAFLRQLQYPIYYMDFESFASAVPLFDGTHAYENIPFQYSLHIERYPGAALEQYSFLAEATADPREDFIRSLCEHLGEQGSVVVYNRQFEGMVLKACAARSPAYASRVRNITGRIVDLLLPFRNFHYYDPQQQGSASIKNVLPALVGTSYEGMAIGDGETASHEYYRVTYTDDAADRAAVYGHLKEYCGLDTKAMVDIVHALQKLG